MEVDNDIEELLNFYYEIITAKEFMNFLNSKPDLQQKFNKVLKKSIPSDYSTPMEFLNFISSKIGTSEDGPINSSDGEEHIWSNSSQSYLILLYAKEFLLKSEAVRFLGQDEINKFILASVTDNAAFYNASQQVEAYIENKIIALMPPFKTLNSAIRYVKLQMKEHFKCDVKMPKWLQSCEWVFAKNGEPMIFKSQRGTARHMTYTFYDKASGIEASVEQFN